MPTLKARTHLDFMGRRRWALGFSATLIIISLVALGVRGLNFGLDFTGGVIVEVGYGQPVKLENVRDALNKAGYTQAVVQSIGGVSDVLIRLPPSRAGAAEKAAQAARAAESTQGQQTRQETAPGAKPVAPGADEAASGAEIGRQVLTALKAQDPNVTLRQTQFIGPEVGADLATQAGLALLVTFLLIFVYVMIRFRWKFAAGALIGLVHDVIITLGFFAIFQWSFDLNVLAAVLSVIGYSLNDTIVVYDRIREDFKSVRRGDPVAIMNVAINQTLSRTINTSLSVLLVLIVLLVLAGDTFGGFSSALIIGVVAGTYSSIYISAALALLFKVKPADMVPAKREEVDALP